MPTFHETNEKTWEILRKNARRIARLNSPSQGSNSPSRGSNSPSQGYERKAFPVEVQKELAYVDICDYCKFPFCGLCIEAKKDTIIPNHNLDKKTGKPKPGKCGKSRELDHIYPVQQSGESKLWNCAVSCRDCNRKKGYQLFKDVRKRISQPGSVSYMWPNCQGQRDLPRFPKI